MAQNNSLGSGWYIQQGANGSQTIKLMPLDGQSKTVNLGNGVFATTAGGQPLKILKATTMSPQALPGAVIKSVTGTKLSQGTIFPQPYQQRTVDGKVLNLARTVQLTPQQFSKITGAGIKMPAKIVNTTSASPVPGPPPLADSPASRRRDLCDEDYTPDTKRRKIEKNKGLRHFSMKVCQKVKEKQTTTYNIVAEELVAEFTDQIKNYKDTVSWQYDQKNIRRRVYDALNVLMAMNIISKEKKEIRWLGLPSDSHQEYEQLEQEKRERLERIRDKTKAIQEMVLHQISFKSLTTRNRLTEQLQNTPPAPNSFIKLPFVIINTDKKTVVNCSISPDKREYDLQFDNKFQILDDLDVLKKIGMLRGLDKGMCTPEDRDILKAMVPVNLRDYVDQLATGSTGMEVYETMAGSTALSSHPASTTAADDENSRHSSGFEGDELTAEDDIDYSDDEDQDSCVSSEDM